MRSFVCGDIHGQYDLFLQMLEEIKFQDEDHLYILGDMIDRGPKSMEVLLDVMKRKNVTCLIGNHELMMHDFLTDSDSYTASAWIMEANGGKNNENAFRALSSKDQTAVMEFIDGLYLQKEVKIGDKDQIYKNKSSKSRNFIIS